MKCHWQIAAVLWLFLATSAETQTVTFYETDEEFCGPFAGWKNLRTDFGAKGDGVTDDTAAVQRAFDALKDMPRLDWSVLYIPAGRYRLTAPVTTRREQHADYLGFSVVGEASEETILVWDGPAGPNMFNLDAWYCKLSRLTFDGQSKANVALMRDGGFSTYCELSDLVFRDLKVGVSFGGGRGDAGQAEHAILRCQFRRCSRAGVVTANFNSLDIYVWHCLFEDCGVGLYNVAGNYHAYGNVFLRSKERDLKLDNLCVFAWVNNVSVGSRCFFEMPGHSWPCPLLVQGNRIYNFTGPFAMKTGTGGSQVLIDNQVRSGQESGGPQPVHLGAGDQLLLGNMFTVTNPVNTSAADARRGRYRILEQRLVGPSQMPIPGTLELPRQLARRARKVFEVKRGAGDDVAEIQGKINAAAAEPPGSRPAVHFPRGEFAVVETLTVPSGCDVQLIGDGPGENGTRLRWTGPATEPLLVLKGPSRATLRDLGISAANGIRIENADQPGGRIYGNQLNLSGAGESPDEFCQYGVLVDGVERADVLLLCGGFGQFQHGLQARGGPLRASGRKAPGQIQVLSGASSRGARMFDVTYGGEVLAQACWYEADWRYSSPFIDLSGKSGTLTIAAMPWAINTDGPFLGLDGFSGTLALLCNNIGQRIYRWTISGDGSQCRFLSLCNSFNMARKDIGVEEVWEDKTSPPASAAMLHCNYWGDKTGPVANVTNGRANAEPGDEFIRSCLEPLRRLRIDPLTPKPAGVTDVKLVRVSISGPGGTLVEIRR